MISYKISPGLDFRQGSLGSLWSKYYADKPRVLEALDEIDKSPVNFELPFKVSVGEYIDFVPPQFESLGGDGEPYVITGKVETIFITIGPKGKVVLLLHLAEIDIE